MMVYGHVPFWNEGGGEGWRKVNNEELREFYFLTVIRVIKSRI